LKLSELSDIQSEGGVIGTLLLHPKYILHTDYLLPDHFSGIENGCMYWAIKELVKDDIKNIDAYNIENKINQNSSIKAKFDDCNMPSVQDCIDLYTDVARDTLEEYTMLAKNVVSYAFRRDLIKLLQSMERKAFKSDNDLDVLNHEMYGELDKLTQKFVVTGEVSTLGEQIDDIWSEIESRRTEDGLYGIPSKYSVFNEYFTYEPGELVVIQAKYKQGKSVFLMNEVVHKLENDVPVLVVDTEMPTRLYTERLLSRISNVDVNRIKKGDYTEKEKAAIDSAREWIKSKKLVHIYDPNMSDQQVYSLAKVLQNNIGLGFLVYDYLKSNETSSSDNYNVLGARCDFFKNNIAGELDLPVLAACQLNRQGEVADSIKINRYLSVGIKWGFKTQEMIAKDGMECGNSYAKIYVNRLGPQMQEDDEEDYADFIFDGNKMTIAEAKQHEKSNEFY